jgi:hypothetical protein
LKFNKHGRLFTVEDDHDDYFMDEEIIPKALPPKGKKGKRGKKEDLPF